VPFVSGTGTLTIAPSNAGQAINLNNGATGLHLSTIEINRIQSDWGSVVIGNTSDTGTMTVGATTWHSPLSLLDGSGSITLSGTQTMGGNTFYANTASGILTLDSAAGVTSSALGDAIVVAMGGNFINDSGSSSPFIASAGRFIGYSYKKSDDTNPVTDQQEITGFTYNSLAPGSIVPATYSATQNTWIYDVAGGGAPSAGGSDLASSNLVFPFTPSSLTTTTTENDCNGAGSAGDANTSAAVGTCPVSYSRNPDGNEVLW
jgi:hypothetical protein